VDMRHRLDRPQRRSAVVPRQDRLRAIKMVLVAAIAGRIHRRRRRRVRALIVMGVDHRDPAMHRVRVWVVATPVRPVRLDQEGHLGRPGRDPAVLRRAGHPATRRRRLADTGVAAIAMHVRYKCHLRLPATPPAPLKIPTDEAEIRVTVEAPITSITDVDGLGGMTSSGVVGKKGTRVALHAMKPLCHPYSVGS